MSDIVRFSVSLERSLLARLQRQVRKHRYANRSEFVRDLLRERLVEAEWDADAQVVGTVTLVYNHETRELSRTLTHVQHHRHELVLATTHVHLDAHMCAEMILVKGRAHDIRDMADRLRRQKGVLHAALSMSSAGKTLT